MADFTSPFWSWFIILPVILGLIGVVWLALANTGKRKDGAPETMGHIWDEDLQEYNNPLPLWWLYMLYLSVAFSVIYLVLYPGLGTFGGVLGWQQTTQYDQEVEQANAALSPLYDQYLSSELPALTGNDEAMRTGARLFSTYCTTCHGSDARGAPGFPNLRDTDWLYGGEPATIKASILNGRNGVMPPWDKTLGSDGVLAVAEYVRSLSGKFGDPNIISAGETQFKMLCVSCHGDAGQGNPQLGAPNLTDEVWLYGGSQQQIMASVGQGRQGKMPPHKEFLGEAKAHLLAAYVYSLSVDKTKSTP
ncbi:MAG: cytochrome-c oxidase, cbb3-type subunit III [Gammaproteobacteria bacterium]|nr:cytochrome-c oxidase, cbb3-type subunit III [Gammaproteobacteria bacterium]MDH3465704.1 cytochrome-c oxidase, cbb3-type subunit III [Gammaproteobacteria bacterium]